MSNKSISKMDMRSATVALAVVAMLIASFGVINNAAADSPITITSDISSADAMVGGPPVVATLTITTNDVVYRMMEVKLNAVSQTGVEWSTQFRDSDNDPIANDIITIGKNPDAVTVKLLIFCDGACSAGDTITYQVYGQSDPRWYPGGNGETCGSSDCLTDTTPASLSSNRTVPIQITLTARTGEDHTLTCDAVSDSGTNEMFQSTSYQWGYDLTNTGWNDDTYTFETSITSNAGSTTISDWTISSGLTNKLLTGQSDTSSSAVHAAEASMTIVPAATARPGVYQISLSAISTSSGNVEGCQFDVVIPEPDLEIKNVDITFSHSSAWINSRGDSQRVTIYADVRNNGGSVDTEGVQVKNVEVIFLVDGSQLGSIVTVPDTNANGVLGYQEEEQVLVTWNPGRAHDSNEVGIPIKVSVDPSVSIQESDADNNIGSTHFKVVKTKASNPSFYLSFLSLVGAVGAAVLMSAYYRNKDSEE